MLKQKIKEKFRSILGINELKAEIDKCKMEIDDLKVAIESYSNELTNLLKQSQQSIEELHSFDRMIVEKINYNIEWDKRIEQKFKYANLEMGNIPTLYESNKNILIVGYYGATNLGDELMLETICNFLAPHGINITVLLDDNDQLDVTYYKNCSYIHSPLNVHELVTMESKFDMVLIGGGAVLEDANYDLFNNRYSLGRFVVDICIRFIQTKKPVFVYGVSAANDITNKEYIYKLNYVVNNATYFSCRDSFSITYLEQIGINVKSIKLIDDIVLANPILNTFSGCIHDSKIKEIGVVFVYNDSKLENLNVLRRFIEYLLDILDEHHEFNYKLKLIPFFTHDKYDELCCKEIVSEFGNKNVEFIDMKQDYASFLDFCSSLDYAISMRYHATLLFNILGIRTLDIIWDTHHHYEFKVNYIYQRYMAERYELKFSDLVKDNYNLIQIEEWLNASDINPKLNREKIVREAQEQLKKLIECIDSLI